MHVLSVIQVDMGECDDLRIKFKIEQLPTFIFFKNGEKIEEWSGSKADELEELIKKQIN